MTYKCFVCGYSGLSEQFYIDGKFSSTFEICPSCGFQYGYHDLNGTGEYPESFKEKYIIISFRKKWIAGGMLWDKGSASPPPNWNPRDQLKEIPKEFLEESENIN